MKERLLKFLKAENKSSAQLAEEIGVQASGISHILSGRNNPSLDFVLKMLEKYQFISTDWLLFGKGTMYKEIQMQTLFDNNIEEDINMEMKSINNETSKSNNVLIQEANDETGVDRSDTNMVKTSSVEKIVWFFDNNSFEEYYPRK